MHIEHQLAMFVHRVVHRYGIKGGGETMFEAKGQKSSFVFVVKHDRKRENISQFDFEIFTPYGWMELFLILCQPDSLVCNPYRSNSLLQWWRQKTGLIWKRPGHTDQR